MEREIKLKWVVIANFLNQTGAAFLWPLTTVYVHDYLHQTMTTAGIVLFLMSAAMILGNFLGGRLFDKWDPYKTAVITVSIATVAVVTLIFSHGWPMYPIMLALIGFGDGASATIINSYAASIKGKSTRHIFNLLYMALNLGVVVGTLLVGVLLSLGITIVFATTSILYVIFLIITILTFNYRPVKKTVEKRKYEKDSKDRRYLIWLICILILTAYLSYSLWESVMAVHLTNMKIPFFAYSLLWTLNGVMIVVGQPFVNRLEPYMKIEKQITLGVAIFATSFALLVFGKSFPFFVFDFALLTIGEMIGLPIIPAWIDKLSGHAQMGKYQGMANMSISIGRAVGPVYGGFMIEKFSYQVLFMSVTVLMVFSLFVVMWSAKKYTQRHQK